METLPAESTGNRLPVRQRDVHFDLSRVDMARWHPMGPHVTHIMNSLSLFFPEGEQFFIDTVRYYRKRITDPQLLEDVRGFIGQEAMHGREHRAFNDALTAAGYPAKELEAKAVKQIELGRKYLPPIGQLAATIALEHFTAIMAEVVLTDKDLFEGAPPEMAMLWRWHAIEETEHKAVAYDVFQTVMKEHPVRAYFIRCSTMFTASIKFLWQTYYTHYRFLKHDGIAGSSGGWKSVWRFLFTKPGILRKIAWPWLTYFKPGFHPWQYDNRRHVDRWKAIYSDRLGEAVALR